MSLYSKNLILEMGKKSFRTEMFMMIVESSTIFMCFRSKKIGARCLLQRNVFDLCVIQMIRITRK